MIGISSNSAGVLLLPKLKTSEYVVLDVIGGKEQDPVEAQYLYSAAQDWEEIEGSDVDDLLKIATNEYWLARTVSLLRLAIGGLEKSLEKEVLNHIEELLISRVSSEKALDRLLVAPLADPHSPLASAESALSYSFSAVASILDELIELQPLLHRLTDLWLGLSTTVSHDYPELKEAIWVTAVEKCGTKQLLIASNGNEFIKVWNRLVFHFATPQYRSGVNALGRELSQQLFPLKGQKVIMTDIIQEVDDPVQCYEKERTISDHKAFMRVEKQITSILQAVSKGHDGKAKKFLRELIQQQTSLSGGESYAVMSLCNIAKQCADMFRMDFEEVCLNEALKLHRYDPWTLIQYGDHLKRVGKYEEALKFFDQAEKFGESDVAKSSIADVYSQRSYYEKAILTYETIPNFREKPKVLNAIADNLRKMGRMEEAQNAYQELIDSAQQGLAEFADNAVRAHAGVAEIAKRAGRLEEAMQSYYRILEQETDDRRRLIYKLGLCNVLKLMDRFEDAYAIVDEVIQDFPFAMEPRFIRGSILGLIGKELEGLKDLPESGGSSSWREWLRPYYRGLLLLKLERYGDAKQNLVGELSKAIASGEEEAILRMATALCFLREGEISEADEILSKIPNIYDCHTQYLSLVLKLHSATKREDLVVMNSLRKQISALKFTDVELEKVVVALGNRNFSLALSYETDALLKLAA